MKAALIALAIMAAAGTDPPPASRCAAAHVPFVARALPQILALAEPPPAALEAGFVLCSRHEDRLLKASAALAAQGYSSYLGAARSGKCLRIPRTHEATVAAMEREVTAMCRIADEHRVTYRHWQTEVGGKSIRFVGRRLIVAD